MQDTLYRIIELLIKDDVIDLIKHNLQVDYDKKLVPYYHEFFIDTLNHGSKKCCKFFKDILNNFYVFIFCLNKSNIHLPREILRNINGYTQYKKVYYSKFTVINNNILTFDNVKILSKFIDLTVVLTDYVINNCIYKRSLIFVAIMNDDTKLIKFLFDHGFNENDKYYCECDGILGKKVSRMTVPEFSTFHILSQFHGVVEN